MVREKVATGSQQTASRFPVKGAVETLAANRTITASEVDRFQAFMFDPGGAGRDVTLPNAKACKGAVLFISNKADAAEILTIKDAAAATILTPTQNECALVFCDGTNWYGMVGDQA